jgi:large conductance mechanosensitive channel
MFKRFKNFILKGSVVDTSVGVVVGVAFGNIVSAIVKDLITPLIAAFGSSPDFSIIYFTINGSKFMVGDFINSLFSFSTITVVVYFLIIAPMERFKEKFESGKTEDPAEKTCPECLSVIPKEAKRCKYCTAPVGKNG